MTKKEALSALENIRNNFLFGNIVTRLIPDSIWKNNINKIAKCKRSDGSIIELPLKEICSILLTKTD